MDAKSEISAGFHDRCSLTQVQWHRLTQMTRFSNQEGLVSKKHFATMAIVAAQPQHLYQWEWCNIWIEFDLILIPPHDFHWQHKRSIQFKSSQISFRIRTLNFIRLRAGLRTRAVPSAPLQFSWRAGITLKKLWCLESGLLINFQSASKNYIWFWILGNCYILLRTVRQ